MAEAIREFVTNPVTKELQVMFKDAITGIELPLNSLLDYDIVAPTANGTLAPVNQDFKPIEEFLQPIPALDESLLNRGSGNGTTLPSTSPREMSNNFGYVNKPGIMGMTNNIPGPIGLGSRLFNGVINMNNAQATSEARKSIGLAPNVTSVGGLAKSVISDKRGQVADVNMNGQTYSVGLEAETKDGRTTLTPDEARKRGMTSSTPMVEATPEESKVNVAAVPSTRGFIDKTLDQAKDFLGGTFDQAKGILGVDKAQPLSGPKIVNTPAPRNTVSTNTAPISPVERQSLGAVNQVNNNTSSLTESKQTSLNQTPSMPGLAGISKTFAKDTYGDIESFDRSNLDPSITKALDNIVEKVGPGIGINSGYRSPEKNKAVGGAKNSQHIQGKAADINISGWSDEQKTAAIEAAASLGVKGVGIYNSGNVMHIDTRKNAATWGPSPEGKYVGVSIDDQPSWARKTITAMRDAGPYNVGPISGPTPTARPNVDAPRTQSNLMSKEKTNNLKGLMNKDISKVSAGELTNTGIGMSLSDIDRTQMAKTLGGELSPAALRGIARKDPKAMAEAASIVSSMTNRMQTEKDVATMTRPSQYNANMTTRNPINGQIPSITTQKNWDRFGAALESVVKEALDGSIQSPTPNATHYSNRAIVNPSYNSKMTEVATIGNHTFGTIPGEFGTKKTKISKEQETKAKNSVASMSSYTGVMAREQKADRKPTVNKDAPTKGLGTKSISTNKDKSSTKTENKTKEKSSKPDNKNSKTSESKAGGIGRR